MICRLLLPDWVKKQPGWNKYELPASIEGDFTLEEIQQLNTHNYNCYFFPNYPSVLEANQNVQAADIDNFKCVFVDLDLKDFNSDNDDRKHNYPDKESFLEKLLYDFPLKPSRIIDSGNGIHAYWNVHDLDAHSFLRLNRRLCRALNTDPAVSKLNQLMRIPGTLNVKDPEVFKECRELLSEDLVYTCEDLDKALPKITAKDEEYCKAHYEKSFNLTNNDITDMDELPAKFHTKAKVGTELHDLFWNKQSDRSAADFRLAHLLMAEGFSRDEALKVMLNTNKATSRAPIHRFNYANDIIQKVYTALESEQDADEEFQFLSKSVKEILRESEQDSEALRGTRLPCSELVDATECGFRLTHVLGLVGGSGSGKTTLALNYFHWFKEKNPEYIHLFVSLEQPVEEIARRWKIICESNPAAYDSVHILGNYNDDGTYRNLSLEEIEAYIKGLEKHTKQKVGCVVIDHIGVLKKQNKNGENQSLIDICQLMKAFAKNTNTFLVMQSQTSREKAGIGDVELDKDAAFGTSLFENFVDWLVTTWQPLKRIYDKEGGEKMTINCFKYCKIRHKNVLTDRLKEDVRYGLKFDPATERLRKMTEEETIAFNYWAPRANGLRNKDKKREVANITTITWTGNNGKADSH